MAKVIYKTGTGGKKMNKQEAVNYLGLKSQASGNILAFVRSIIDWLKNGV